MEIYVRSVVTTDTYVGTITAPNFRHIPSNSMAVLCTLKRDSVQTSWHSLKDAVSLTVLTWKRIPLKPMQGWWFPQLQKATLWFLHTGSERSANHPSPQERAPLAIKTTTNSIHCLQKHTRATASCNSPSRQYTASFKSIWSHYTASLRTADLTTQHL